MLYSVLNSKQKQLYGHKSNKMRESTLLWIGNFEEKIDLSHIYLAVHCIGDCFENFQQKNKFLMIFVHLLGKLGKEKYL